MKKKAPAATAGRARIFAEWLLASLRRIYNSLPLIPYLDRPTSALAYIAIFLYVFFVGAVFLASPKIQIATTVFEPQFSRNADLRLRPGETYGYVLASEKKSAQIYYSVFSGASCSGIGVLEEQSKMAVCLGPDGRTADGASASSNFTLGNQSIALFAPWMLGLSNSSDWTVETAYSYQGAEIRMPVSYVSQGERSIAGRRAFLVKVVASPSVSNDMYIDAEKRVLLFADFGNATIRLVRAPFALNWSASSGN